MLVLVLSLVLAAMVPFHGFDAGLSVLVAVGVADVVVHSRCLTVGHTLRQR